MRSSPGLLEIGMRLHLVVLFYALLASLLAASPARSEDVTGSALDAAASPEPETEPPAQRFEIKGYEVEGTQLYSKEVLGWTLHQFTGPDRTGDDVEAARAYLQREFERVGYPTLIVIIPEQTIVGGIVRLEVIEGKVGEVRVVGNKHYSDDWIKGFFPELRPGRPLNQPEMAKALEKVNKNREHEVAAVLAPGQQTGTTDLELRVNDQSPWDARVEMNNYSTEGTPDLRMATEVKYKNLWGREHVLTASWETSPQDFNAVNSIFASYILPIRRWGHSLAFYGAYSDSTSFFRVPGVDVEFGTFGKELTIGARYTAPLWDIGDYEQKVVLGVDYKYSDQRLAAVSGADTLELKTPVRYVPFSVGYSGELVDRYGVTNVFGTVNFNFGNVLPRLNNTKTFENRSPGASSYYVYGTFGASRLQRLWRKWTAYAQVDGQVANGPLIDLEFFKMGGHNTVRGFKEQVLAGDEGMHGTIQLITPKVPTGLPERVKADLKFLTFFDYAKVSLLSSFGNSSSESSIQSAGAGVRFSLYEKLFVEFDYGWPIELAPDLAGLDPGFDGRGDLRVYLQF